HLLGSSGHSSLHALVKPPSAVGSQVAGGAALDPASSAAAGSPSRPPASSYTTGGLAPASSGRLCSVPAPTSSATTGTGATTGDSTLIAGVCPALASSPSVERPGSPALALASTPGVVPGSPESSSSRVDWHATTSEIVAPTVSHV